MYTFRQRLDLMIGKDAPGWVWVCRLLWFLFALWTMHDPHRDTYIGPGTWLLMVFIYYFYF